MKAHLFRIKEILEALSLKNKIFFSIVLAILLISATIALLAKWILIASLTQELETRGFAIGHSIAERGRGFVLEQDYPRLLALIFDEAKLKERRELIAYIFVVDAENKVISHTFVQSFPRELRVFLEQNKVRKDSSVHLLSVQGKSIFDIQTPIREGIYEIGRVHVGLNKAHMDNLVGKLRVMFLGFISLVIVFIFWLSHKISSNITRPLVSLTKAAQEVSRGNFEVSLGGDDQEIQCPAFLNHHFPCWHLDELGFRQDQEKDVHSCPECLFYKKGEGDEVSQLRSAFINMIWSIRLYRKRLKESEEKYRSLFVSGPEPIFVIEVKDLKILDVNPRAAEVYEYTDEELRKLYFWELWPEAQNFLQEEDSVLFQQGYLYLSRVIHFKKNKKAFFVNIHACPISYEQRQAIILSANDVTEMVEKDAQIIQAGKMKALGEMAAGIAHELNQPLNSIKMGADLLAFVLSGKASLERNEIIAVANDLGVQVKRASEIINNLRQFSRKSRLIPEKVDLNKVVYSVLSILKQQLSLNDIEVELDLLEELPLILGYENRMQQVIFNLINNARDAILEKKCLNKLERYKGKIIIGTQREAKGVILFIQDNGIGLSPENKERIFEPFFTTKEKGKGMGLGLAIVKSIIKDHRGVIDLEALQEGAKFKLWFPCVEEL
ncbi:histidine kinase [Desulfonauticus submarinus]|uniref:histidine kinase n=1 Tax=Desulfonauticus submarinus TaxID=206665 RepID=A0A1H0BVD7_9BACT|nr:ATP-binding protein [Desulfonauticus submarinus]SDN49624.1 histidine kinase [Desulfonauticus submarinus]